MPGPAFLNYPQAAKRVKRDVRTIRRWRSEGLAFEQVNGQLVVREDALLEFYRAKLKAWPIHQQRMRVLRRGSAATPIPAQGSPERV